MVQPPPKPGRVALVTGVATLAIFAGLVLVLTFQLRAGLRGEVLRREAEAIYSVALLQLRGTEARLAEFGGGDALDDIFAAVLRSSDLRGVVALQLFDPAGTLREALPVKGEVSPAERWWPGDLAEPRARFVPHGSLEAALGFAPEPGLEPSRVPLLDVVVPVRPEPRGPVLGIARYWVNGESVAAEFARLDRALAWQAGSALAGGALLLSLVLAWAFSRLARAHRQLVEQSLDLERANQELDFAAKTGALGAISAHLIHGLKNPLAGIEGFVAEHATGTANPLRGQAWHTAMETTRRLRGLVNEVVTVLRDEADGAADYRVPVIELVDAAKARAGALAENAGVTLTAEAQRGVHLTARNANLAGLVLANLLTNAIEATPRGGRVGLEARLAGERVEFRISDSGGGLPAGVQSALFRPVQSGKRGGGGVGLAISQRLAKHAGGELELVRSDAAGTVFQLSIPVMAA